MANIAGTVEAILTMRDELSPVIAEVEKNLPGMNEQFEEGQKLIDGWSESNQRAALRMEKLHEEALKMNASLEGTNDAATRTAQTVSLAARGFDDVAKSAGFSTSAVSTLAPAVDLLGIGFTGLKTTAVGFTAATVGVIAAGAAIGVTLGNLLNKLEAVRFAADSYTGALKNLAELEKVEGEQAKFQAEIAKVSTQARIDQVKQLKATGTSLATLSKDYKDLSEATRKELGITEQSVKAHKEAESQAKAHAEQIKKLADQFSGVAIVNQWRDFNTALAANKTVTNAALTEANRLAKALSDQEINVGGLVGAIQQMNFGMANAKMLGGELATEIEGLSAETIAYNEAMERQAEEERIANQNWERKRAALEDAAKKHKELTDSIHLAAQGAREFASLIGGFSGEMISTVADMADMFAEAGVNLNSMATAAGMLGQTLSQSANPAVAKLGSALSGAAAGAKLGTQILPGWGTAIGAVAGAIGGFVLGGQKMIKMINDQRDAFFELHGGYEGLVEELSALGLTGEQVSMQIQDIFDADTPEEYAAAVATVNDQLAIEKDRIAALEEGTNKVKEAMDRYGLTIEQMGPKFQQQELDKQALKLLEDYELLIAAGAENNTVIAAMGPNINEYVNASRAAGTTIPKNLEPVINSMIEQGLLLDENGNAFASVEDAGLSFAETVEESMARAVDEIERLVNAILGIQQTAGRGVHIPVHYDDPGPPGHEPEGFAQGTGGFRDFGQGTLAMLHGSEAVMTPSQLTAVMMGAGSGAMSKSQLDALTKSIIQGVRDGVLLTLR